MTRPPEYLAPYLRAARYHGGGFGSLLWASPTTQAARFDAMMRLVEMNGATILDVGCGRADLLDHLLVQGVRPAQYIGLEAVPELADAAEAKRLPRSTIIRADFVDQPLRMLVGAEIVAFSGSLNTLADDDFASTLRTAFQAARWAVVFNFLCSPRLAGQDYLRWRPRAVVKRLCLGIAGNVQTLDDYLDGDCTAAMLRDSLVPSDRYSGRG
ncbi:MAG: hypothetical protein ACREIT_10320 [Tepidisphaeraceae bacterium]